MYDDEMQEIITYGVYVIVYAITTFISVWLPERIIRCAIRIRSKRWLKNQPKMITQVGPYR